MNMSTEEERQQKNRKLVRLLIIAVVSMFAFGFLLVPLYNVLCQAIGLNGKTNTKPMVASKNAKIDKSRTIIVQFIATNNDNIPNWEFRPMKASLKLHPNEDVKIAYYAKNSSKEPKTIQAIPSVTPGVAAKHLIKVECFCFHQQTFKPGQSMKMDLIFHLDDKLPKYINTVTLSYTVFDITKRR